MAVIFTHDVGEILCERGRIIQFIRKECRRRFWAAQHVLQGFADIVFVVDCEQINSIIHNFFAVNLVAPTCS